jgi:hypothetical protein
MGGQAAVSGSSYPLFYSPRYSVRSRAALMMLSASMP